jgi:hypothetical protein
MVVVTGIAALALAAGAAAPAVAQPACFGAAARDPLVPCTNPSLRLTVTPTPQQARNRPNSPCTLLNPNALVQVCAFGVPEDKATATVALFGDSHAAHWRAALEVVAQAKQWRGLSLMQPGCPFSKLNRNLRYALRHNCVRWKRKLPAWFAAHPEVQTVFVVGETGGAWRVAHGRSAFPAEVKGVRSAWRTLPSSVKRVIVIHDTPKDLDSTATCIRRAVAQRRPAGMACAVPRRVALDRDPAVKAAAQLDSPRFSTVDLTHFFCDRKRCYPVVGGALVHKDTHHMTAVFAATLGPYLLRSIDELSPRISMMRATPGW